MGPASCVLLLGLVAGSRVPAFADVKDALARAYGGVVTADTGRPPSFVAGDFNWDGSEDLAVLVTPVDGKLDAINSEVANWVLEDPMKVRVPDFLPRRARVCRLRLAPRSRRTSRSRGDSRSRSDGWRSRQTATSICFATPERPRSGACRAPSSTPAPASSQESIP